MRNVLKSIGSVRSRLIFILTCLFFALNAESQENNIIRRNQDLPQWSPDGKKYACAETWSSEGVSERQIMMYWEDKTPIDAKLCGLGDIEFKNAPIAAFFSWAPDSEHYVFTRSTENGYDLFIGNLNGEIEQFTNDKQADLFPRWSPNKYKTKQYYIAYMRENKIFLQKIKEEEKKFKPEGTPLEILPEGYEEAILPEWSPDGTKLAFSASKQDNFDIFIYDVQEKQYSCLTDTSDIQECHPVWSPDGQWIAFYSKSKDTDHFGISIIKADNTKATEQIRPGEGSFDSQRHEVLLVDNVHYSMILGPAWMPSSQHLVYVRPDDNVIVNTIMMVEFSLESGEVIVKSLPIEDITTQTYSKPNYSDVQCAPNEAKLIFSRYVHYRGGEGYRNIDIYPFERQVRDVSLEVSFIDQKYPLKEDEVHFETEAQISIMERKTEKNQYFLSWQMKCAVGDAVRGVVKCPGYSPLAIFIPVLQASGENKEERQLYLSEKNVEVRVVAQDNKGKKGAEVSINGECLGKTSKEGVVVGKLKLRITNPIELTTFPYQISSENEKSLLEWGIESLQIQFLSPKSYYIEIQKPEMQDEVVSKLIITVHIKVPETTIHLLVQDQDGEPLQGIQVSRIIENEAQPMGATNLNGEILLTFIELPNTVITLRLKQAEGIADYQDLEFCIPQENNAIIPPSAAKVPWVVNLDSVKGKEKIIVMDDEGKPYFQIEPLVLTLECVYPDNTPIKNKEVKYNGGLIAIDENGKNKTTDENGKIKIEIFTIKKAQISHNDFIEGWKRYLAIKEAQNLTIDGYPLKKSGIDTKLELDIPCTTTLTVFVEDANSKKIPGVEITTSGTNQAGEKVKKFSTKNGTDFRIYQDTATLSFSEGDNQAEVEIELKPGSIEKVKDLQNIIAKIKGKELIVKHPSNWEKMESQ